MLGEWLAIAPILPAPSCEQITSSIAYFVKRFTQGNKEAFARYIHFPGAMVYQWCSVGYKPQLRSILQLCFYTGVSLVDFLTGKIPGSNSEPKVSQAEPCIEQRGKPKPCDVHKVKEALEAALQNTEGKQISLTKLSRSLGYTRTTLRRHFPDFALAHKQRRRQAAEQRKLQKEVSELERATRREKKKLAHNSLPAKLEATFQATEHTPIPLKKVAQQLGFSTVYLRKYFPDQCHAFVSRYKEFSTERSRVHEQRMYNEVREIVLDLNNQGKNPNHYEVSKVLKHPGVFRNPKVRAVVDETIRAIASTQQQVQT